MSQFNFTKLQSYFLGSGEAVMQTSNKSFIQAFTMNAHRWLNIKAPRLLVVASLFLFSSTAFAINTLNEITYTTLPGNRIQLAFQLDQPPEKPRSFTIGNPARISLDLANTKIGLDSRVVPIGIGVARSVSTAEANDRTRVVLNMATLVPYKTHIEGNTLYLTLESEDAEVEKEPASATSAVMTGDVGGSAPMPAAGASFARFESDSDEAPDTSGMSTNHRYIKDVDFRRGPAGEGRIVVTLSTAGIPMDINEDGGKIFVDFLSTDMPSKLIRRLDVLDFATPVESIDSIINEKNARLVIKPSTKEYEQLAYQSDNVFTIELKPIPKEELEQKVKEKFGYTGERLSLNFQDIEVRSVLQLLADFTELNVVVSDTVTGKLTLRLKNVPWDQALDIILKSKALGMRKNGNVLLIAPTEEIAAREKLELEALQQVEELAPLKTAFIQINYGKAETISTMIKGDESSILSERGNVTTDARTNTLLVQDTDEKLTEIRALVQKLDVPVRQVMIESRIVIASDDFNKELGVKWGVHHDSLGSGTTGNGVQIGGNTSSVEDLIDNSTVTSSRYNVNLPVAAPTSSIALAFTTLPFGTLLELELSALQAEGKGEIISNPRIITANQKKAIIKQGVEIPYLEQSSSGAATVTFREAMLSLEVTPQITPDERVILDLTVNKDAVGELFGVGTTVVPSIDTRELETQILVNNGETVVLGGIYEQTKRNQVNRVPFFSELPLIGDWFKSTQNEDDKSELLVFVTPKIVRDSSGLDY